MTDTSRNHFNDIAQTYHEEVADHVRDHLIQKWWGLVGHYFDRDRDVIDIGCGEGTNARFLQDKGAEVIGVDASEELIEQGLKRYPELAGKMHVGNALSLDFEDNAFDLATLIGVLHHIYSRDDQLKAIREALRVVKPGGTVLIRESNLINPLFRLFWNYIFPLTAKIDRFGGENWIPAKYLASVFGDQVDSVRFFTFIPSFTPKWMFPVATRIEQRLENGRFSKLAAHYVLALKKSPPTM
ncbi:MAG: class I SAM-dependent methyltransferase [Thiohalomonadales bacterium]